MARKEVTELVDDLDGTQLDGDGETVTFAFRGVEFEIDLSTKNAAKLDKVLEPYLSAARRTGGRRARGSNRASTPVDPSQLAAVRAWARDNGHKVSERGRISRDVQDAYQQAH